MTTMHLNTAITNAIVLGEAMQRLVGMIDRSQVNRALAKAIAYKQCGKDHKANSWAIELIRLLECHAILNEQAKLFQPATE